MLTDRRLPKISFKACRVNGGFQVEQRHEPGEARLYILRFDIAGGDPKNVALYHSGKPIGFVNRCGYTVGEGLYIKDTLYLERNGDGYCFVSGELPSEHDGYEVYECATSREWFDMFRTETKLIGTPDRGKPRMVYRPRRRVSTVKGGYMQ